MIDQTDVRTVDQNGSGRTVGEDNAGRGPAGTPAGDAAAAQQRWDQLARQGKWMIAVYQVSQSTLLDVVRLRRAHLHDKFKVRIEAQLGHLVRDQASEKLEMEDRRVLGVPEERILWYEIIDESGPEDVLRFRAALERSVQVSRKISHRHDARVLLPEWLTRQAATLSAPPCRCLEQQKLAPIDRKRFSNDSLIAALRRP
jgi:hypothetical protein